MPLDLLKALNHSHLQQDFFQTQEQIATTYSKKQLPGSSISFAHVFQGHASYWKRIALQQPEPSKKPILLSDPYFAGNDADRQSLVAALLENGFALFILNQQNQLCEFEPKQVFDPTYRKKFFANMRCGRKTPSNPQPITYIEHYLKIADPEVEKWHILDHCAVEKILYLAKSEEEALPTPIPYQLTFNNDRDVDLLAPTHVRYEQVTTLVIRADVFDAVDLSQFPALKKINCARVIPPEFLTASKISELTLSSTDEHISLSNLLATLEVVDITACKSLKALPVGLPDTLKELYLDELELLCHLSDPPPSNLEVLIIKNDCSRDPDRFNKLQTTLNQLTKLKKFTLSISLEKIPEFPDSLEELDLSDCEGLEQLPKQFPTGLRKLILSDIWFEKLPFEQLQALEELYLHNSNKVFFFSGKLPPTLKILHINGFHMLTALPELPADLIELDLYCERLTQLPEKLPPGLKVLDISCEALSRLPELPEGLTTLGLFHSEKLQLPKKLPAGLTSLKISRYNVSTTLPELPSSLTELWVDSRGGLELPERWPPGLKKLHIETWRQATPLQLSLLPASLTNLSLESVNLLPDTWPTGLKILELSHFNEITTLPPFPPGLAELHIQHCNIRWPEKLPAGLKILKVGHCEGLITLAELPADLTELLISGNPSPQLPETLPLGLKILKINNSELTTLPELPPELTKLQLENCSKLQCLPEKLPPGLQILDLDSLSCSPEITALPELPEGLRELLLNGCNKLQSLPELPAGLKILDLRGCKALSQDLIARLKIKHPKLVIRHDKSKTKGRNHQGRTGQFTYRSGADLGQQISLEDGDEDELTLDSHTKTDRQPVASYTIYQSKAGVGLQPVPPEFYRQHIWNSVAVSDPRTGQLKLIKPPRLVAESLPSPVRYKTQRFTQAEAMALPRDYYFTEYLVYRSYDAIPLPGLTTNDTITDIYLPPGSQLRYNPDSQQYLLSWEPVTKDKQGDDSDDEDDDIQGPGFALQYVFNSRSLPISPPRIMYDATSRHIALTLRHLFDQPLIGQMHLDAHLPFADAVEDIAIEVDPASDRPSSPFAWLYTEIARNRIFQASPAQRIAFALDKDHGLVKFFHLFTDADLVEDGQPDYLRILSQAKGACRHRAFLYLLLCQSLALPVRVVGNEVHAFAELWVADHWRRVSLGGVGSCIDKPVPLLFAADSKSPPRCEVKQHSIVPKVKRSSYTPDFSPYFSAQQPLLTADQKAPPTTSSLLQALAQQKNALLRISTLAAGRGLYAALQDTLKLPIFYIESPDDLDAYWQLFHVGADGGKQLREGPLQQVLKAKTPALLIFNWGGRFTATDIAGLMSVNDGILAGLTLADTVQVLNLVTPSAPVEDRFYSRSREVLWPTDLPLPAPLAIQTSLAKETKASKNTLVDLYRGTIDWQALLIGSIQPQGKTLSYQPGALQTALRDKASGITLINPPWQDALFQRFMLDLHCGRCFIANGEILCLPRDFTLAQTTVAPKATVLPESAAHAEDAVFYVNRMNLASLRMQTILTPSGPSTLDWLSLPARKHLVVTEPLQDEQLRYLSETLAKLPSSTPLSLEQLSSTMAEPLPAAFTEGDESLLTQGGILETWDPYFIARCLQSRARCLIFPIHLHTAMDELIEEIQVVQDAKKATTGFSLQLKAASLALQAGQTVVLYGQLSADLYQALEPLFDRRPRLKLSNAGSAQAMPGRLLVVTLPLAFRPQLAVQRGRHRRLPEGWAQWQAYAEQLNQDYPAHQYPHYPKLLEKIVHFYQAAQQIPHGQAGLPARLHLSYSRLCQMLQALVTTENDNPLKAFFHHDYSHDSEAYAYVNVLAKFLFGKVSRAGVRWEKLADYPHPDSDFWRRLNCLNAEGLRAVFIQLPDFQCRDKAEQGRRLQTWLSSQRASLDAIPRQTNPQAKLLATLEHQLQQHAVLSLKGEPGTGKTHGARAYAKRHGDLIFEGEAGIVAWLTALKTADRSGKHWVLIGDEANMSTAGYWDFLLPLLHPPRDTAGRLLPEACEIRYQGIAYRVFPIAQKVIFMSNPANQASTAANRIDQGILQDCPQFYVKSWARETLTQHLLLPLLSQLAPKISANKTLEDLLTAVQIVIELLEHPTQERLLTPPPSAAVVSRKISVRDIQQLLCRWLHQLPAAATSKAYAQAAYEACCLEWSHCFEPAQRQVFLQQMQDLFKPVQLQLARFQGMSAYQMPLKNYFLCQAQQAWLLTICHNLALANKQRQRNPVDGTRLTKTGVLLEGSSGLGKTSLLVALLEAQGFKRCDPEVLLASREADFSGAYIQFTPGQNIQQDQALLEKAFDSGCKVVLDELNLSPALEKSLNQLLSGTILDLTLGQQRAARVAGFYLLASQNGQGHLGNKSSSAALHNRLQVLRVALRPEDLQEMADIALLPHVRDDQQRRVIASDMVVDFLQQQSRQPGMVNTRNFLQGLKKIVGQERGSWWRKEPDRLLSLAKTGLFASSASCAKEEALYIPGTGEPRKRRRGKDGDDAIVEPDKARCLASINTTTH